MQLRMFSAHSRSVSLAFRQTGVPAMFGSTHDKERTQAKDMRLEGGRCFLNRRPMLALKVYLVTLKQHW